jgi:hypothetical protein
VGASKNGEFSARACAAELLSSKQELEVASDAWSVDIDVLGADMDTGSPVVAFQIKKRDIAEPSEYRIYSLQDARLLRTLTGGDFYNAADTNLDGHIEIWTDDAIGADGFERIPLTSYDFAPTVVLRFEKQKLMDVSSQFASYYDAKIAALRSQLAAQDLHEFMESDGLPTGDNRMPFDRLHRLQQTKIKVLEIVWCYLYSGRERDAFQALQPMWPAADVERIRAAIVNAQQHGIRKEIDGVAAVPLLQHAKLHHVEIYEASTKLEWVSNIAGMEGVEQSGYDKGYNPAPDSKPKAIDLFRPEPTIPEAGAANAPERLDMVIDEAGKVSKVKLVGKNEDKDLIAATEGWKFIPAFKDGHAVACRLLYDVRGRQ